MPAPLIAGLFAGLGALLRRYLAGLVALLIPSLKDLFFKILTSLGFSFVSYKLTSSILQSVLDKFSSSYYALSPDLIGLLGLAGVPDAFDSVFGAFNVCIGIFTAGKAIKFLQKGK